MEGVFGVTVRSIPSYIFSVAESVGALTAKNHLVLHNPAGSGKKMFLSAYFGSHVTLAPLTLTAPLRAYRCSGSVTGGSLQLDSAVCKFIETQPDPAAEVYTANPTVTLGAAFLNSPANVDKRASAVHAVEAPLPFLLLPGNGVVFRQEAFSADIFWNISIIWREDNL